jgi:hypothetical protein
MPTIPCTAQTTGQAGLWNGYFAAQDYFELAFIADQSELVTSKSGALVGQVAFSYRAKAHRLTSQLLAQSLTTDLRGKVRELWKLSTS